MARAVMDFPEPLSPASPTISPAPRSSSGTRATTRGPKATSRSRMAITELLARVEDGAQAVAQEVEAERGHEDGQAGEGDDPPVGLEELLALVDHQAPLRG